MPAKPLFFRDILFALAAISPLAFVVAGAQEYFPLKLTTEPPASGRTVFLSPAGELRAEFVASPPWEQPPFCVVEVRPRRGSTAVGTTFAGMTYLGGMCSATGALLAAEERGKTVFVRFGADGREIARTHAEIPPSAAVFAGVSPEVALVHVGKRLVIIMLRDSAIAANTVADNDVAAVAADFSLKTGAYISRTAAAASVHFLDSSGRETSSFRLPDYNRYSLTLRGNTAGIAAANQVAVSFCYVFRDRKGMTETGITDTPPELSAVIPAAKSAVVAVRPDGGGYAVVTRAVSPPAAARAVAVPEGFVGPTAVIADSLLVVLFGNGLLLVSEEGEIIAAHRFAPGAGNSPPQAGIAGGAVFLRHGANTSLFRIEEESFYLLKRLGAAGAGAAAYVAAGIALLALYRRYRVVRRALNATLEHGGAGVVFLLDASGRLRRVNHAARTLLGISADVPLGRPFGYYCIDDGLKAVGGFVENAFADRSPAQEHISAHRETLREYILAAVPLRSSLAQFRGLIVTGVDITEELEKKRLVNWAQLAHDMQTNLSVIRLNAERLTNDGSTANEDRRRKILHQSAIVLQKVRDIVTVGRSDDMQIAPADAAELCRGVIAEFDETMFPHAELRAELRSCTLDCDSRKLSRALRNLIENGVKALKNKPGTIIVSCRTQDADVLFSVSDTGVGMSGEVRGNILRPYYTTAYHEGGSGIGTMIIQKAVELHRGRIEIRSEEGHGSTFTLIIPRRYHERRPDKR